ncbi:MAG: PAS domain S-box protein [Candidatus Thorarchaeota archaeon]|nr:PAS domain S-box protein [Candidatus Thorarchaeota archaeon]
MAIRVLMVDDDPVHLELSDQFLRRQSPEYEIISTETAEEAMNFLLGEKLDAVVCDIDLGESSSTGLDILEQVRINENDIPVIIFTGKSREEIAIQALNLGADYYIRKGSSQIEGLYAELSYYILTAVKKRRTERALVESERRLRDSEERLAEAQRIAHLGYWNWDIINDNIVWSDETYRIFGLAPQEFEATYEAFLNSVHEDDRKMVRESVDKAIHKNQKYSIDHRIVLPDESIRFVHEEAEVTFDDKGKATRMLGTVQDLTERVVQETLLREERDKAQRYLDLAGTMILALDSKFNVTMINQKGCQLLECEERDIIGSNWIDEYIPDQSRQMAVDYLTSLVAGESGGSCEMVIVTSSGVLKKILCEERVLVDEDGHVTTILCSARELDLSDKEGLMAEDTSQVEDDWWQGVFDDAPESIGIFNSEGKLIDINKAGIELLGLKTKEDAFGLDLFEESNLPGDVLESVRKGETHRFDYKWSFEYVKERGILETSRSDVIYMDVTLSSLQDKNGHARGYVMHVSDMTERRQTETALSANEEMFRTIFEESPICIELFDSDGILIGANQAALELFGVSALEDFIGFDLFADPNTPEYVKTSLGNREIAICETRFDFSKVKINSLYKTKKSGIMHLDCVYSPIKYGKEEDLQGFIIHIQDVTDRTLAEQALVESRESFKELYNNALVGLFRARISDGMILECNDQFAKSFGFEGKESLTDGSSFVKDTFLTSQEWDKLKTKLHEEHRFVSELRVSKRDGEHRWMRFSLSLWSEKGYIEGVMADITEQKNALEMLKKQKEELSDFAHSMGHDLKNIFHNMLGFIELAEEEKNLSHLAKLRSLVQETGQMVDHSVALADAGLIIEETSNVDLSVLVKEVAESTIPDNIEFSQDSLPVVDADQRKIAQIFRNLFDNAVQHGQPSKIVVSTTTSAETYRIKVMNDGKTIPETIRAKIFLRGFTTSKNGQGFGLAIVKRLVEAHGWTIKLLKDRETTFEIEIPIIQT